MLLKKLILFITLNLIISTMLLSQNLPVIINKSTEVQILGGKEYFIHIVKRGHTLYSLSKVYEIPIDEISFENPEVRNGLFISQILKIPVVSRDELIKSEIRNKNFDFFYHIASNNERLREIAEIYSVSRRDLQYANPGIYDPIKEGQYIKVPVLVNNNIRRTDRPKQKKTLKPNDKKPSVSYQIHTVKAGDNLYRLAKKYGCSIDGIKRINPRLSNSIHLGQMILIPRVGSNKTFISHTVQRKERLAKIARNYDVKLDEIRNLNPLIKDRPFPGQKVKIPIEITRRTKISNLIEEKVPLIEESMNQDSIDCFDDIANLTKEYRIALMIPFYLEEFDSLKIDRNTEFDQFIKERPFRSLQFYYGALMAIDSLKKQGLNIDLNVYDVDVGLTKTMKVFQNKELQEMDLIIGPFFRDAFTIAANFAKIFSIPIINPMSTRPDFINNNPYIYKFQPTDQFHYEEIRNLVHTYYSGAKIFFLKHRKTEFDRTFKPYQDKISDLLIEDFKLANDDLYELLIDKSMTDTTLIEDLLPYITIEGDTVGLDYLEFNLGDSTVFQNNITEIYYSTDSIKCFEQYASTTRENVVFTITDNNVFALDVMTQLNVLRDTFPSTVIGLANWTKFKNMDNEILLNLNVHTLNFTHIDYNNPRVKSFITDYRKRYLTEPGSYAFTAFDISWYFLQALMTFGSDFNSCLPYFNPLLIQSEVDFYRKNDKSGMENRGLQMLKYENYQIKKVLTFPPPEIDEVINF